MNRFFLVIVALIFTISSHAQNNITIGLVMPEEELDGVKPDAYKILGSRLEKMLTASGVSSFGGDFVMYPVVNIIEENLIEGGIKNFFKIKIELTLNVANLSSKTLFASESWTLSGSSERYRSNAVKNAFGNLRGNDPRFMSLVENTKKRISDYYVANKSAILAKASSLSASGEYEEAIALLSNYPSQVSGSNEAQALLHKVYTKYTNNNASRILNEARAAFATKDYDQAVSLASQIDPESSHYNEAKAIINQVRSTINREEAAEHQREMKALEIQADIQKTKINAEASVARAYYNRKVITYNNIVNYRFVRIY